MDDDSLVQVEEFINKGIEVLILVVVGNGLVLMERLDLKNIEKMVLILVVVDDGLVLSLQGVLRLFLGCLNPYCSGRWSRTSTMILSSGLSKVKS